MYFQPNLLTLFVQTIQMNLMSLIDGVVRATSSANLRSVSHSPSIHSSSPMAAVKNFGEIVSPCLTPL